MHNTAVGQRPRRGKGPRVSGLFAVAFLLAACISPLSMAPPGGGLDAYLDQCFSETQELRRAFLEYDEGPEIVKSQAHRYSATLSSRPTGEPGQTSAELGVACSVSARLVASSERLEVTPSEWQQQKYLPQQPSTWTWVVTGKAAGQAAAVLEVKPAIELSSPDGGSTRVEDLRTEQLPVNFSVTTTWGQKLTSGWGLATGLATGIVTILGAWFAIRKLRDREA